MIMNEEKKESESEGYWTYDSLFNEVEKGDFLIIFTYGDNMVWGRLSNIIQILEGGKEQYILALEELEIRLTINGEEREWLKIKKGIIPLNNVKFLYVLEEGSVKLIEKYKSEGKEIGIKESNIEGLSYI